MRLLLFIAAIAMSLSAIAQKQDTVYFDAKWEPTTKQEASYYRLIVKDTTFYVQDYFMDGGLQMEGRYLTLDPEVKDGVFSYYTNEGLITNRSYYRVGKKYKPSVYYNASGELDSKLYDPDFMESMPEFPGGIPKLLEYLSSKLVYPKEAQKNGIQGTVFVRFVVSEKGVVEEVSVVNSLHPAIDQEAMRVVKQMPKWKPGKFEGRAVSVWYTLPIRFTLS